MPSSSTVSDRKRKDALGSIYEPSRFRATNSGTDTRVVRAASGLGIGAGAWLVLTTLGVPQILGIHVIQGLVPLAIAASLLSLTRLRTAMVWAMAGLTALLIVVAHTGLVRTAALRLVRADTLPPSADAIVVLSAGMTDDGMLPQQAVDRLLYGLELAKAGIARAILITHETRLVDGKQLSTIGDQVRIARLAGIPNVIDAGVVTSTREEALAVSRIAKARGWRRVILVTSPFHSRRACATFEKTGLQVSCAPSASRDIAVTRLDDSKDRIGAFAMLIYETAGTLRYRQQGWL